MYYVQRIFVLIVLLCGSNSYGQSEPNDERIKAIKKVSQLGFVENKGQLKDTKGGQIPWVFYKAQTSGLDLYVTSSGLTYVFKEYTKQPVSSEHSNTDPEKRSGKKLKWSRVDMHLEGAEIKVENLKPTAQKQGVHNYYYSHCPEGISNVKSWNKIVIENVYPNIDWVIYGTTRSGAKYDFIVHPGGNPNDIKLQYNSANGLDLSEGSIRIKNQTGELTEHQPVSFQEGEQITTRFVKESRSNFREGYQTKIGFTVEEYDPSKTLVIDPLLTWSTMFGGNGNDGFLAIEHDNFDNVLITGYTYSTNFPALNNGNYFDGTLDGLQDVIILKFDNGNRLGWATYYGGDGSDIAHSVTVDNNGNTFIVGDTKSTDFPLQDAGTYFSDVLGALQDAFILKFNSAGVRQWATLYGGAGDGDTFIAVCSDPAGNIYASGSSNSGVLDLKDAGGYFDNTRGGDVDALITQFDNTGNLVWATLYGGSQIDRGYGIGFKNGTLCVGGFTASPDIDTQNSGTYYDSDLSGNQNVFLTKFDASYNLTWGTYFGGTATERLESLTMDDDGNLFIAGSTVSTDFPSKSAGGYLDDIKNGTFDVFIAKFEADNSHAWATLYGGIGSEKHSSFDNLATDKCGNVYWAFEVQSNDLHVFDPGCGSYFNPFHGGNKDIFYTKFGRNGHLQWATYWGGVDKDFRSPVSVSKLDGSTLIASGECADCTSLDDWTLEDPGAGAFFVDTFAGDDDSFLAKFGQVPLSLNSDQQNPQNCNCTGSAKVSVCSAPPYTYKWSNGVTRDQTTDTVHELTDLCPGNYWVEVEDGNCNIDTVFYTLSGGNDLLTTDIELTILDSCDRFGGTTANAKVTATGGNPPYEYSWNDSGNQTTQTALGLSVGTYIVTVTDDNGCTTTDSVTIEHRIILTTTAVDPTCSGCSDGSATVTISGTGTPPYTYRWDDPAEQTTATATGLTDGAYTILVTDSNGCFVTADVTVGIVGIEELNEIDFQIIPNPSNGRLKVQLQSEQNNRPYSFVIYDSFGKRVRSYENVTGQLTVDMSDEAPGVYLSTIIVEGARIRTKELLILGNE